MAAGQLPDVVAHGIKADAALRLGVGVCRGPPGLALQAIFLHQILHAIDDGGDGEAAQLPFVVGPHLLDVTVCLLFRQLGMFNPDLNKGIMNVDSMPREFKKQYLLDQLLSCFLWFDSLG